MTRVVPLAGGATGPTGPTGATGPQGATGATGPAGAGGSGAGVGSGAVTDIGAVATGINPPAANANYRVILSDANVGTYNDYVLVFPTPPSTTAAHWLRITYVTRDRTRRVSMLPYRVGNAGSNQPFVTREMQVLPGPSVNSVTTITYLYDPGAGAWYVSDYWGDAVVRQHRNPTAWTGVDYGLPVYVSPELGGDINTTSWLKSRVDYALQGVEAIPYGLRKRIGSKGVWFDLVQDDLDESIAGRAYGGPSIYGVWLADFGSLTARYSAATNGNIRGFTGMHEFGHAVDEFHLPIVTTEANTLGPGSPEFDLIWGDLRGTANSSRISDCAGFISIYATQSPYITRYGGGSATNRHEWCAETLAIRWAEQAGNYVSTGLTDAKNAVIVNSTDWATLMDYYDLLLVP